MVFTSFSARSAWIASLTGRSADVAPGCAALDRCHEQRPAAKVELGHQVGESVELVATFGLRYQRCNVVVFPVAEHRVALVITGDRDELVCLACPTAGALRPSRPGVPVDLAGPGPIARGP